MEKRARVLIDCEDAKGLVYKISKVFYDRGLNIDNNREFVDKEHGRFFMRTVVSGLFDVQELRDELKTVTPNDAQIRVIEPKDKKIIKAVAESFRPNPNFSTVEILPELGIGEGLVSALDESGRPLPVEKTLMAPPSSRIGPAKPAEKQATIRQSPHAGRFEDAINRESAHEVLKKRAEAKMQETERVEATQEKSRKSRSSNRQTPTEAFLKGLARAVGSQLGRRVVRGILGSLFKG